MLNNGLLLRERVSPIHQAAEAPSQATWGRDFQGKVRFIGDLSGHIRLLSQQIPLAVSAFRPLLAKRNDSSPTLFMRDFTFSDIDIRAMSSRITLRGGSVPRNRKLSDSLREVPDPDGIFEHLVEAVGIFEDLAADVLVIETAKCQQSGWRSMLEGKTLSAVRISNVPECRTGPPRIHRDGIPGTRLLSSPDPRLLGLFPDAHSDATKGEIVLFDGIETDHGSPRVAPGERIPRISALGTFV